MRIFIELATGIMLKFGNIPESFRKESGKNLERFRKRIREESGKQAESMRKATGHPLEMFRKET